MVKIMENLIKMDDLGVPLFLETPISKTHSVDDWNRIEWKAHDETHKRVINMHLIRQVRSPACPNYLDLVLSF